MNPVHEREYIPSDMTESNAKITLLDSFSALIDSTKNNIKNNGRVTLNISVSKNPAKVCDM